MLAAPPVSGYNARVSGDRRRYGIRMLSFYVLLVIGVLAVAQGLASLRGGRHFLGFVRRDLEQPPPPWTPFATVVLPCKGVDRRLVETLKQVAAQDYPAYEVICAVESADDPAYRVIQSAIADSKSSGVGLAGFRCVVAGLAQGCAQKITNHLAGLAVADPRSEAFVFLDSDAVPPQGWLRALVAPLREERIGATTGYRWYVPTGALPSLVRSVWNASALTFLGDHKYNFVWGGSVAMRRAVFERLGIAERWRNALSEDYLITRAMHQNQLDIRFVPRCVLLSDEEATWSFIGRFARRQLVITRVCHWKFWMVALAMAVQFTAGFWGWMIWLAAGGYAVGGWPRVAAWGIPLMVYGLAIWKSALRDRAVALLFPDPAQRRGVFLLDAFAAPVIGLMHLALLLSSATNNRFWWRGVLYEMVSVDQTRILARKGDTAA